MDAKTDRIQLALRGKVPRDTSFRSIHCARGQGIRCDGCALPIEEDELEYELEFATDSGPLMLHLHPECWRRWRSDRLS